MTSNHSCCSLAVSSFEEPSSEIRIYSAPLEAVTTHVFRRAHHKYYPGVDKYFIPFIEPHEKRDFNARERKEICRENNAGVPVVPQILTKNADGFHHLFSFMKLEGYSEINFNLGCPSGTVTSKGKGSGFLASPDELDDFLARIYAENEAPISIKTRIGRFRPEEFPALLDIYNKYPISELTVHPRTREDFYNGSPDLSAFTYAMEHSKNPICYNGDIWTPADYAQLLRRYPTLKAVMIGRGLVANPELAEQIRTSSFAELSDAPDQDPFAGKSVLFQTERFRAFHDQIYREYTELSSGEQQVLMKMKELWTYWSRSFAKREEVWKQIKKIKKASEYESAVRRILGC